MTPSDLTYKGLGIGEVKELELGGEIEEVYALSPLQEGMYYHWLAEPGTTAYVEQSSYGLEGLLDTGVLRESYERLVERHGILRTRFSHAYGPVSLQIVSREAAADFRYADIGGLEDQEGYVEGYKEADRREGFDLGSGSQMRLTVLDRGAGHYAFIWCYPSYPDGRVVCRAADPGAVRDLWQPGRGAEADAGEGISVCELYPMVIGTRPVGGRVLLAGVPGGI